MNLEPFLVNKRKSYSVLWRWRVYFIYFEVTLILSSISGIVAAFIPSFKDETRVRFPADALFTIFLIKKYKFEHECAKGSIRLAYLLFAFSFKNFKTEYTVHASIFFGNATSCLTYFSKRCHTSFFFFFFLRGFLH